MDGQNIHVVLPVAVGLVIGILEAFFVYQDESSVSGKDFLADMWHGLIFCILGVLVASNVPYLLSLFELPGFVNSILFLDEVSGISFTVCVLITIFMLLKMTASHALKGISANGFKEKFWHKLVIALLVGFSPYYIMYLYEPLSGLQALVPWLPF